MAALLPGGKPRGGSFAATDLPVDTPIAGRAPSLWADRYERPVPTRTGSIQEPRSPEWVNLCGVVLGRSGLFEVVE